MVIRRRCCLSWRRARDEAVRTALADGGVGLIATGSPYAVTPGRVRKQDGEPFRVFTPFYRAWVQHGWRAPAKSGQSTVEWIDPDTVAESASLPEPDDAMPPKAGEAAALASWATFTKDALADYPTDRDRPDLPGTSNLSAYLH